MSFEEQLAVQYVKNIDEKLDATIAELNKIADCCNDLNDRLKLLEDALSVQNKKVIGFDVNEAIREEEDGE
jgi:hypothetical protein